MLNLPAETFWLIVPWPFIWLTLGIVVYFFKRRDDALEDEYYNSKTDNEELKE